MTKTKTHLIEDQSIGGLKREYVEVDRKAVIGDYVYSPFENKTMEVLGVSERNKAYNVIEERSYIGIDHVRTLAPTDIVHYEAQRYRIVDRIAEVGEKVVITESETDELIPGDIYTAVETTNIGTVETAEEDYLVYSSEYRVLVPVEESARWSDVRREPTQPTLDELLPQVTPENRHTEAFVDKSEASPSVIEMLANLAQRIVALEKQTEDSALRIVDLEQDKARLLDEIDVLHSNQKRMGEELANATTPTAPNSNEVIVELTKILVDVYRRSR